MAGDPRWQLAERIAGSPTFEKAQRLRELLLYLTEHVLLAPDAPVHEQEIGHALFGRQPDYDTSQDSLVRVQASKLRRRLEHYFSAEGSSEPVVVALPPGSYAPVFRPREPEVARLRTGSTRAHRAAIAALCVAVVCLAALSAWLWRDRVRLRQEWLPHEAGPLVERFWGQVHAGDTTPLVVMSDSNLTLFQDLLGRRLTLQEYRGWHGLESASRRLESDLAQRTAGWALSHFFVPFNEVQAFHRIEEASRLVGTHPELRFARLVDSVELSSGSVVLLGNGRVNPWVTAHDDRRQFRFHFRRELEKNKAYIENVSPQAGEQSEYVVRWQQVSYCVVAYLPNRNRTGTVLILEGADTGATVAGAELLTQESWMEDLRKRLPPPATRFPFFEVLLEAQLLERRADRFSIVAHRVHRFDPSAEARER